MKKVILLFSGAIGLVSGAFIGLSYFLSRMYYEQFGIDITQWIADWTELTLITQDGLVNFCFIMVNTFLTCGAVILAERLTHYTPSAMPKKKRAIVIRVGYILILLLPVALSLIRYVLEGIPNLFNELPVVICSSVFALCLYVRRYSPRILFIRVKDIRKRWILGVIVILLMAIQPYYYVRLKIAALEKSQTHTTAYYGNQRLDHLYYLGSSRNYYFLYSSNTKTSYVLRRDLTELEMVYGNRQLIIK